MNAADLRSRFPVLDHVAYLNAGTDGPIPAAAVEAASAELESALADGRTTAHFKRRSELLGRLRAGYAAVLGCAPEEVALQTSTSEGVGRVLAGLDLGPEDEIVTSDQEHPGVLGPLKAARDRGATIRPGPLATLADTVGERTTLVVCSHVGWVSGEYADPRLADLDIPVLLDGAQGAGAVPVDVKALGCAAYAASGQKWLCGADGTGLLYVEPGFGERLRCHAPSYISFEDAGQGIDGPLKDDARRYDTPSLSRESAAFSLASLRVLEEAGWESVHTRAREQAASLAERLAERGRTVAPRGATTLVSWEDDDPAASRDRLAEAGVVVRNLPGRPYLRASVGAWTSDDDLERLLAA
jgi:L-cysteine/cystine lyase